MSLPTFSKWWRLVACAVALATGGCSTAPPSEADSEHLVGTPHPDSAHDEKRDPDGEPENRTFRRGALWYRIAISGEDLEIAVRLLNPADRTSFFLPASKRGPETTGAISIREAEGPNGNLALRQVTEDRRIDVETASADWVELHYRVDLGAFPDDSSRPHPDVGGGALIVYLSSILVVPSKQVVENIRDIPVEVHAPESWSVLATWARGTESTDDEAKGVHGFVARDTRSLRDAFFVAGKQLRVRKSKRDDLTVAFQPDVRVAGGAKTEKQVTTRLSRIVRTYETQFGNLGETLVYVRPSRGGAATGVRGTAKRNGFVVRLPRRRPLRDAVELLFAHEAFHLWNGHHLIPDPEDEKETRWFKEGVTHYVALKTLRGLDLFDLDDVRRELAKSAFFYRRNPATRGGQASRLDMNRLPYDRGVLLALALDGALAQCTSFETDLRDWLRALLRDGASHYGLQQLSATYEKTAGTNCTRGERIWRRHVRRGLPIEPSPLFERVGLHYLEASTIDDTEVLPIESRRRVFETLFERSRRPTASESRSEANPAPHRPAKR